MRSTGLATLLALGASSVAVGQHREASSVGAHRVPLAGRDSIGCAAVSITSLQTPACRDSSRQPGFAGQGDADRNSSGWAILASAVLPGAGQILLGVNRFAPYVALEAFAWLQYTSHYHDFRWQRDAYRDLAARVARAPFSADWPIGDFEYYERMKHYQRSGAFDAIPGGAIDPEPDSTTYNGAMWLLARRTYWSDPGVAPDTASIEHKRALEFYERRAYGDAFRWSWVGVDDKLDEFRRLIRRSNDSNRKSVQDLGIVIANHFLSMIDAYVTLRIRRDFQVQSLRWEVAGAVPMSALAR